MCFESFCHTSNIFTSGSFRGTHAIKVHVFAAPRTATASPVNRPKARLWLVRLALVVSRSEARRRV